MVLVVERDRDIGESLCSIIREWGMECEVVKCFDDAINEISHKEFESVLIDVGRVFDDADSFIDFCKERYDNPNIIIMSASNSKLLETYADRMGIKKYLSKPFDLKQMEQVLQK